MSIPAINDLVAACNRLTQTVEGTIADIDARVAAAEAQITTYLQGARREQSHYRLTKNQALVGDDFPDGWSQGTMKSARKLETVHNNVEPEQRTARAREFLRAINSDTRYFAGAFHIWELEYYPNRRNDDIDKHAYLMYQHIRTPTLYTAAAIVKHIRGVVPKHFWCAGLAAGEPAKLCGTQALYNRNTYTHCHPYAKGYGLPETDTGLIEVALPAVVSGYVDLTEGLWGQFPYLSDFD